MHFRIHSVTSFQTSIILGVFFLSSWSMSKSNSPQETNVSVPKYDQQINWPLLLSNFMLYAFSLWIGIETKLNWTGRNSFFSECYKCNMWHIPNISILNCSDFEWMSNELMSQPSQQMNVQLDRSGINYLIWYHMTCIDNR